MSINNRGWKQTEESKLHINLLNHPEKKTKTPIINAVYSILYEGKDPKKTFKKLTEKLN